MLILIHARVLQPPVSPRHPSSAARLRSGQRLAASVDLGSSPRSPSRLARPSPPVLAGALPLLRVSRSSRSELRPSPSSSRRLSTAFSACCALILVAHQCSPRFRVIHTSSTPLSASVHPVFTFRLLSSHTYSHLLISGHFRDGELGADGAHGRFSPTTALSAAILVARPFPLSLR